MGSEGPKTIRLRRIGAPVPQQINTLLPQEDLIQKNLQPLIEHTEKKKRAQEAYYDKNVLNKSPLLRNLKAPVRNRLGRRIPFNGTNTSAIPPKKRLFKVNNGMNGTLRNTITRGKVTRKNLAQIRINRIRERQQEELRLNPMRLTTPKKIKLKRWTGSQMLRVEVPNVNYSNAPRHRQILNSELQEQIRELQSVHIPEQILFDDSYTPFSTKITTHERFAKLNALRPLLRSKTNDNGEKITEIEFENHHASIREVALDFNISL
ncbi:unnamed protein product [Phyllotreta striolata]|uniref:Uncharacterized protein n=1 Tax=Phyllotreta striolata TaxID=444603 RepID=A0A9N9T9R4_PHYSR|nr:unnamed protein product [Phyllotreta striolata]